MTTATAIKVGAMGGKPTDMSELVELLVRGAGGKKGADASDSEYIEEQWWATDSGDEAVDDGPRGHDS